MADRFLFAWRHALASDAGPIGRDGRAGSSGPVCRHVGLTLSLYFNSDGLGAWPSQDTLAARTGLSAKAVNRALKTLCEQGWLTREGRPGPSRRRHKRWGFEYRATLPRALAQSYWKGERASLFKGGEKRKPPRPEKPDAASPRKVTQRPTNTSPELVKELAIRKGRRPRAEGAETPAAQQVRQQRAARDRFVADYEAEQAQEAAAAKATITPPGGTHE